MFTKKSTTLPPQFNSRADAFQYMLTNQMEQGADPMVAAQKAGEFADIYAQNMALPDRTAPAPEGLDKYLAQIDKLSDYCDRHPKLVDLLVGAASFVGGILVNKTVSNSEHHTPPPQHHEPIDFDNID
jgi:hypothetical protein